MPAERVTPKFKWVKAGDVIDIGAGRKFEVIPVPGHTLGCVLFVDFANKIAITGDAISSGSWVYNLWWPGGRSGNPGLDWTWSRGRSRKP
jgi:glyoxylase-like metal-dependent hydrolase (beta-lactamase superfamily II)